jgi:hypothetical protein
MKQKIIKYNFDNYDDYDDNNNVNHSHIPKFVYNFIFSDA